MCRFEKTLNEDVKFIDDFFAICVNNLDDDIDVYLNVFSFKDWIVSVLVGSEKVIPIWERPSNKTGKNKKKSQNQDPFQRTKANTGSLMDFGIFILCTALLILEINPLFETPCMLFRVYHISKK